MASLVYDMKINIQDKKLGIVDNLLDKISEKIQKISQKPFFKKANADVEKLQDNTKDLQGSLNKAFDSNQINEFNRKLDDTNKKAQTLSDRFDNVRKKIRLSILGIAGMIAGMAAASVNKAKDAGYRKFEADRLKTTQYDLYALQQTEKKHGAEGFISGNLENLRNQIDNAIQNNSLGAFGIAGLDLDFDKLQEMKKGNTTQIYFDLMEKFREQLKNDPSLSFNSAFTDSLNQLLGLSTSDLEATMGWAKDYTENRKNAKNEIGSLDKLAKANEARADLMEKFNNALQNIAEKIMPTLLVGMKALADFLSALKESGVFDLIESGLKALGDALKWIAEEITKFVKKIQEMWDPNKGFFGNVGGIAKSGAKSAFNSATEAFSNWWNGDKNEADTKKTQALAQKRGEAINKSVKEAKEAKINPTINSTINVNNTQITNDKHAKLKTDVTQEVATQGAINAR